MPRRYRRPLSIVLLAAAALAGFLMYSRHQSEALWGHLPLLLYLLAWGSIAAYTLCKASRMSDRRFLLSTASGVLLGIGFPGYLPVPFLLLIAWVPLLLLQHENRSARTIFLHGLNTFLLYNILATFWVTNTAFAAGLFAVMVNSLLMCIPWMAFHWTTRVSPGLAYYGLLAFWLTFEHFHYHWSLNWPWLTLGNGFAEFPSLVQWYEITGTLGGSAWILVTNCLLLHVYLRRHELPLESGRLRYAALLCVIGPPLLSLIRYHTYDLSHPDLDAPYHSPLTVSAIQPNLEPHYEKFAGDTKAQAALFSRLSQEAIQAAADSVDYLLLPETSFHRVEESAVTDAPALAATISSLSDASLSYFITGISSYRIFNDGEPPTEAVRYYPQSDGSELAVERLNGAAQIDLASGDYQTYRKGVFVPGAESFPFRDLLFFLEPLVNSLGGTVAGLGTQPDRTPFTGERASVAPVICYESVFGEYFTDYVREGAQAAFVMTNDGWWDNTAGHLQHLYLSSLRAIETRRDVVRSANMGACAFIDQRGHVVSRTRYGERGYLNGTVSLNDGLTFYVRYGDLVSRLAWLLAVVVVLSNLTYVLRRRRGAL